MHIIKQGESVSTRIHYVTCEKCFCEYEAQEKEGNAVTDGVVFLCPNCNKTNISLFKDMEWNKNNKEYEEEERKRLEEWDKGSWWKRFWMGPRDGYDMC